MEGLNSYSGFMSLLSLIIAIIGIPLSIILAISGKELYQRYLKYSAMRSIKSIEERFAFIEKRKSFTKRLLTEPSFTTSIFINLTIRAIIFLFIILLCVNLVNFANTFLNIYFQPSVKAEDLLRVFTEIVIPAYVLSFIGIFFSLELFIFKIIDIYDYSYRIENYDKWEAKINIEILKLNERKAKLENANKTNDKRP